MADLLRGDFKQSDYGKIILPFTVLRRLDCVLEATKPAVLRELEDKKAMGLTPDPFLLRVSSQSFYNISPMDMKKRHDVVNDGEIPDKVLANAPATQDHFFLVPKVVE